MGKQKITEELNVLSNEEISQIGDIQNALEIINQEGILTGIEPIEAKKFIVEKNKDIQKFTKSNPEEKNEAELDEIANQADQAFYDLMDIAINTPGKACGDIASSAQSFLNIKLSAKLAKTEAKYKKLNYELQLKKLEASQKKFEDAPDEDDDDGIIVLNPNQ